MTSVYEASEHYLEAGTPLVVLSGKEYGSGSSRDWAAKGTALLGVKAVIAESYERIHRSNLIGMGVLPLQYPEGENAESLGLTGEETFSITGVTALNDGTTPRTVKVKAGRQGVRRGRPDRHPRRGQLLPQRRDHAVRAEEPAQKLIPREAGERISRSPTSAARYCEGSAVPSLVRRCALPLSVTIAAGVLAALPAAAAPTWVPAVEVQNDGRPSRSTRSWPSTARAPRRWCGSRSRRSTDLTVRASTHPVGGTWSPPQDLSAVGAVEDAARPGRRRGRRRRRRVDPGRRTP